LLVVIDGASKRDAQVPDSFLAVQWVSLARGQISAAFIERISQLLGTDPAHVPAEVSSVSSAPRNTASIPVAPNTATVRPSRGLLFLGLGVALAGAAALGIAIVVEAPGVDRADLDFHPGGAASANLGIREVYRRASVRGLE
jgi:hypothetical protein